MFYIYYGVVKGFIVKKLGGYDIVLIIYQIVVGEGVVVLYIGDIFLVKKLRLSIIKLGFLVMIKWKRVVVDEGYQLKNFKVKSEFFCEVRI